MMRHVLAAICAAFLVFAAPAQGLAEDFLSKNDRRLVQQSLTQSGYNTRGVDGVFGKGTRRAIRDWQATNGYRATGRLTEAQFNAIIGGRNVQFQSRSGDNDAWAEARALNDDRAYQSYLRRYPNWLHAEKARARLDRRRLADIRADRERALGLNRNQRREVEQLLARSGYYPGSINGKFGPTTRQAIRDYRRDRRLPEHAYLDREMLRYLVRENDRGFSPRYNSRQNGEDNTDIAVGVAAGALLLGGIILLAD